MSLVARKNVFVHVGEAVSLEEAGDRIRWDGTVFDPSFDFFLFKLNFLRFERRMIESDNIESLALRAGLLVLNDYAEAGLSLFSYTGESNNEHGD